MLKQLCQVKITLPNAVINLREILLGIEKGTLKRVRPLSFYSFLPIGQADCVVFLEN